MTKAEQIKKRARKTIVQLRALERLISSLIKGLPAPKVRPKRKKAVRRKPLAKKREKRRNSSTPQAFGISLETESSWEEFIADTHRLYLLEYLERAQAREEAAVSQFLGAREG